MTVKIHISTTGWFWFEWVILTAEKMAPCWSDLEQKKIKTKQRKDAFCYFVPISKQLQTWNISHDLPLNKHTQMLKHTLTCSSDSMFARFLIYLLCLAPSLLSVSLHHAFETSVNIDFIYLIDTAHADTGTLHKQWRNALETPCDEQRRGG